MKFEQSCLLFEKLLLDFIKDHKTSPSYNDIKPIKTWNEQREYIYLQLLSYMAALQACNVREKGKSFNELYSEFGINTINKETKYGFDIFSNLSENDVNHIFDTFKLILAQDYSPPFNQPLMLFSHLISIYFYYCFMTLTSSEIKSAISGNIIFTLDNAMTQIIEKATTISMKLKEYGFGQEKAHKGNKEKKRIKQLRKKLVIEKFNNIQRKDSLSLNRIAKIIQEDLKKDGTIIKSPNTIKRYLREAGLI